MGAEIEMRNCVSKLVIANRLLLLFNSNRFKTCASRPIHTTMQLWAVSILPISDCLFRRAKPINTMESMYKINEAHVNKRISCNWDLHSSLHSASSAAGLEHIHTIRITGYSNNATKAAKSCIIRSWLSMALRNLWIFILQWTTHFFTIRYFVHFGFPFTSICHHISTCLWAPRRMFTMGP